MGKYKKSAGPTEQQPSRISWLWYAVDLLAGEYGWAKRAILEDVYLDEFYNLREIINARRATVPITRPAEPEEQSYIHQTEPDVEGLTNLKRLMSNGRAFLVK